MNSDRVREICKIRLGQWTDDLVEAHATPVVLVAVGHDHKRGTIHVVTVEEVGDNELSLFVYEALEHILNRRAQGS